MTIDFYGDVFDKYEYDHSKAYIGYFSPNGKLVDYNSDLCNNHCNLESIISWLFLLWIKNSNLFNDIGIKDIKTIASLNNKTGQIDNVNIPRNDGVLETNLVLLQKDLLSFLQVLEKNPIIVSRIRNCIDINKIPNNHNLVESVYEIERVFGKENTKNLLILLKDICIQYLGYDAIERVKPNGEFIVMPPNYKMIGIKSYNYFDKPRIITTTSPCVNKRFYNYLLMNWKVEQMPKFVLNSNGVYEPISVNDYAIQSESDMIYKKEIDAIKKMVPLKERPKYFR